MDAMNQNGGPAFPRASTGEVIDFDPGEYGMTLRDWFAGQALPGLIALDSDAGINGIVSDAYEYADAMLEEGRKEE